jgi:hypothetical protein
MACVVRGACNRFIRSEILVRGCRFSSFIFSLWMDLLYKYDGFAVLFYFIWLVDLSLHAVMIVSRLLSRVPFLLISGRTEGRFRFRSDGARWCELSDKHW